MFNAGSNLLTMIMVGAMIGAPAAYIGNNFGYGKAVKEHRGERQMFVNREIFLWHELGAARQAQYDLIENVEQIWSLTGAARREMRAALEVQKQEARVQREAAAAAIARLDYVEATWKDQRVPDVLVRPFCLRDGDADCDSAEAGANDNLDVEVRQPAPGNGG